MSENSKYNLFRSLLLHGIKICIHEMKKHNKKILKNFITTEEWLQKNTIKNKNNKKQRIVQPKYVFLNIQMSLVLQCLTYKIILNFL